MHLSSLLTISHTALKVLGIVGFPSGLASFYLTYRSTPYELTPSQGGHMEISRSGGIMVFIVVSVRFVSAEMDGYGL